MQLSPIVQTMPFQSGSTIKTGNVSTSLPAGIETLATVHLAADETLRKVIFRNMPAAGKSSDIFRESAAIAALRIQMNAEIEGSKTPTMGEKQHLTEELLAKALAKFPPAYCPTEIRVWTDKEIPEGLK